VTSVVKNAIELHEALIYFCTYKQRKIKNYEIELLEMCCIAFCSNGTGRGNVITTQTGRKNV